MSPVAALWMLLLSQVASLGSRCFFYFDSRIKTSGNFSTPGWPEHYPPGLRCQYVFRGNVTQGIQIFFSQFSLEPPYRSGCLSDYLDISTVDHVGVRWFQGRYCGREIGTPFQTLHPQAELLFVSNQAVADKGFTASFVFTEEASTFPSATPLGEGDAQCGGLLTGPGGVLTSPGYPSGFPGGLACTWLLRADPGQHVYVRMEELQLQGSIANCRRAELAIYDGYLSSYGEAEEKLKSFCGDLQYYRNSADKVVLSHRNRLVLTFRTGEPSDNTTQRAGFKISWTQVYFASRQSCERRGWFWCGRSVFCLGVVREGGCITTANFCIHPALVCDGSPGCSDGDDTDERACTRALVAAAVSLSGVAVAGAVVVAVIVAVVGRRRRMRGSPSSNHCLALVSNASTPAAHLSSPDGRPCGPAALNHIPLLGPSPPLPRLPSASFTSLPTATSEPLFPTPTEATPETPSSVRTDDEVEKDLVPESTSATTELPTPATPEEATTVTESNSEGSSGSTKQSSEPNCSSAASTVKDLSLLQTAQVPQSSSASYRSGDITDVAATSAESEICKKAWRNFQETHQASPFRRYPLQPKEKERETHTDGESNEDITSEERLALHCVRHQHPQAVSKSSKNHRDRDFDDDRDPPNYFDCDFAFPTATRSLPQTPTTPRRRTATWTMTWEDPKKRNMTINRQKSSCCGKTSPDDSSLQDPPPTIDSPIPRWPPTPPLPPSRLHGADLAHSCPRRLHDLTHSPLHCSPHHHHHHHHHQPLRHHHHHHLRHRHDHCPPYPFASSMCRHPVLPRRLQGGAQHHRLHHQPNHHHHHHHHGHHDHPHHTSWGVTRSYSWSSSLGRPRAPSGGRQTEV